MANKKTDMPRFDFAPDDEYDERVVKLSEAKWAMLDKYCGFVEKKRGHRPSYGKVFDTLLNNLFGTDKAFRHSAGLVRPKKPSAKSKPEEEAQVETPELKPTAVTQNAVTQKAQPSLVETARHEQANLIPAEPAPLRVNTPNQDKAQPVAPDTAQPSNVSSERAREFPIPAQTQATNNTTQRNAVQPSLTSKTASTERAVSERKTSNPQPPTPQTRTTEPTPPQTSSWQRR